MASGRFLATAIACGVCVWCAACGEKPTKKKAQEDEGGAGGEAAASATPAAGVPSETGGAAGEPGAEAIAGAAGQGGPPSGEVEVPCPPGVLGHCSSGEVYADYPGYELSLVEDFPSVLDLNADPIVTWSDGMVAGGQTAFRSEQISFSDGNMVITAEPPPGCPVQTANPGCIPASTSYAEALDPNPQADIPAAGVWSGELRTRYNNYRYGRYEVKFRAPLANPEQTTRDNAAGFMATFFAFRAPKNVQWNEIDLELSPNFHDQVQGNVVSATGQTSYPSMNASPFSQPGPGGYDITQDHLYAFTWTSTKIEWFLDGQLVKSFAGTADVPIPALSAKIMMNLWMFSSATFGPPANNQYPIQATYDYFRFYRLTGETYPCADPPGCLPGPDKTVSSGNNPVVK